MSEEEIKEIINEINSGKSLSEICRERDIHYYRTYAEIKKSSYSDSVNHRSGARSKTAMKAHKNRRKFSEDEILKLYDEYINGENLYELADKYEVSAAGIHHWFNARGLPRRSKSDAMKLLFEKYPERREYFRQLVYDGISGYPNNAKRKSWIEAACEEWLVKNNLEFDAEYRIKGYGHAYDFRCGDVLIEMDGVYWHNTPENIINDKEFERIAEENGYTVIRITDEELKSNPNIFESVLKCLLNKT